MPPNEPGSEGRERPTAGRVVRSPTPHDSAVRHVTGHALYVDDMPEALDLLHLAPGYAPLTVGTIKHKDLQPVVQSPGVIAVLTADDIPGTNDVSPSGAGDDPIMARDSVSFHGQVLFAVVAESHNAARRAARRAKFAPAPTMPIIDVADALTANTTVLPDYTFHRGDAAEAVAKSEVRLTGQFHVGGQEHFYLEGQAALAIPGEDNDILVVSSTQHPSEVQHVIAHMLDIPFNSVTVEVRRMGGAFGGKESQATQWAALAALAAWRTGRPCKIRLDRDDDMVMTGKRHDFRIDYGVGFNRQGQVQAVDTVLAARCGFSRDLSLGVVDRAMFHADNAYFYPSVRIVGRRMKTNTVSNTAFRGFGGPQGMMCAERMMDHIAYTLKLDPLDVRKANFYGPGGRNLTPYGMRVEDNILPDLVGQLERTSDYRHRRRQIAEFNAKSPVLKRGMALTPVKFGIAFTLMPLNQAGALVHLYRDGSVHLNHGGTEMGQGLFIKVAQVVADAFGVDLGRVKITATSTAKVPNTGPTAASSGTDLNAMAALNACETIKDRLHDFIEERWQVERERVEFKQNHVLVGNQMMTLADLARQASDARIQLSAAGFHTTPKVHWDRDKASGRPFYYFAYGACCSQVVVDTMTGEMKVERADILHDVGRSINPAVDIGQIEGGFVQGMGWLTTEELVWDSAGRLRTHAPSTYKIPCASDLPEDFRVDLFESGGNREESIYRSKAVGEPPLMLAISVFCAIVNALAQLRPGQMPRLDAPATPEAILKAVRSLSGAGQ